jgi:hypothetical protein
MITTGLYKVDVKDLKKVLQTKGFDPSKCPQIKEAYVYVPDEFFYALDDFGETVKKFDYEFFMNWDTAMDTALYSEQIVDPVNIPSFVEKYKDDWNAYLFVYLENGWLIISAYGEGSGITKLPRNKLVYGWMDEDFTVVFEEI